MTSIIDCNFSLVSHLTDFMRPQRICVVTKLTINEVPLLDTITGSRIKRILNIFNHLSN